MDKNRASVLTNEGIENKTIGQVYIVKPMSVYWNTHGSRNKY